MYLTLDHDLLVESAQQLPPLPQSAARLAGLLADEDTDLREIVRVIEYDPALTIRLLRVANSALSASRRKIGTVQEAVIRLGTNTIAGLVIASSVRPLIVETIPGYNISGHDFWVHSLAAAFAAEAIQARSPKWSSHLAFTTGLLHDIGKLVLGKFLTPELCAWLERARTEGKRSPFEAEAEILSLHHGEVGAVIAQHWGLPETLAKGIEYHHDPAAGVDEVCYVVFLANLVAHRLPELEAPHDAGKEPAMPEPVGEALTRLGLDDKSLVDVGRDVRESVQAVSGQLG